MTHASKLMVLVSSLGGGGAERVATTLCNAWCAAGCSVALTPTFDADSSTRILSLSEKEKKVYFEFYGTQEYRFRILPPTLDRNRRIPADPASVRRR